MESYVTNEIEAYRQVGGWAVSNLVCPAQQATSSLSSEEGREEGDVQTYLLSAVVDRQTDTHTTLPGGVRQ